MLNHLRTPGKYRMSAYAPYGLRLLVASALILIFFQSACSKKSKAVFTPPAPARIAFLPFNVPEDQKDLQWAALAAPILLSEVCKSAPDLEAIPFWESMQVAIDSAGASRIFTEESAESAASWLSAKWGTMGEISAAPKNRVAVIVDFIPARSKQVPFRYMNTAKMDSIADGFPKAFTQFLRYLAVRPLEESKGNNPQMSSMKDLAEALDREYGWFVEAEPGKADIVIADLMTTDEDLARFLFNPNVYPQLKTD